jgi:hypothetical protein
VVTSVLATSRLVVRHSIATAVEQVPETCFT